MQFNDANVYPFGPLESVTKTEFQRMYNTNVLGSLLATQEAHCFCHQPQQMPVDNLGELPEHENIHPANCTPCRLQ